MAVARSVVFSPVGGEGVVEMAVRRLGEAIAVGLIDIGEQLPTELELAEQLGIATVSVREALAVLGAGATSRRGAGAAAARSSAGRSCPSLRRPRGPALTSASAIAVSPSSVTCASSTSPSPGLRRRWRPNGAARRTPGSLPPWPTRWKSSRAMPPSVAPTAGSTSRSPEPPGRPVLSHSRRRSRPS